MKSETFEGVDLLTMAGHKFYAPKVKKKKKKKF